MSFKQRTNIFQATPANPTGANSTTTQYMGLAASITPQSTGKIFIMICGDVSNSVGADGAKMLIQYGTGTAPANRVSATGTSAGNVVILTQNFAAANNSCPFSCNGVVSNLVVGTTYWVDLAVATITGGVASPKNISISILET